MIGVVVQPEEQETAREFFELCKTPWEFYRDNGTYDLLLCTIAPLPTAFAPLRLIFSAEVAAFSSTKRLGIKSQREGTAVIHAGRQFPIYGPLATFPPDGIDLIQEAETRRPVLYACRTDGATVVHVGYNLLAEIRHLLTLGQPVQFARVATLDLHLALFRDLIVRAGVPLVEIPPVPEGHKFIVSLSHDIDHPRLRNHCCDHTMFGFLYRATIDALLRYVRGRISMGKLGLNLFAALKLPLVYFGLARDFWSNFDRFIDLEGGRPSTFFVIPERDNAGGSLNGVNSPKRACRYEVTELLPQLKRIVAAGSEVGLHGLDAWQNAGAGRREMERLRQSLETCGGGVRMHWLYFDQRSPAALDEAGFDYDSTAGYNETVGYRAGTGQVYRPLGVQHLLELPLHIMDTALFYPSYLNLGEKEAHLIIARMILGATVSGGVLTINWHDRSIAPERLWGDFYEQLLRELQAHDPWFATATATVAWYRMRRAVVFEQVQKNAGTFRMRSRCTTLDTSLPGLRIRLHKPHILNQGQHLATGPDVGFVDTPHKDTVEIPLAP